MARVALVGPEIEENLSLRYLASALACAGHSADIVAFNDERDFGAVLSAITQAAPQAAPGPGAAAPPALVGLSLAFQWRARDFLALAVALRDRGWRGHVTAGGHFGTFARHEILREFPEIDSVCRQEAEITIVQLAEAIERSAPLEGVAGLALRTSDGAVVDTAAPPLPDLASIARPDRRGDPASCFGHGIAPLVSSRGCYANCSFCCIAAWHEQSLPGKRYRVRDPDDVAAEMVALQRDRGIDVFVFHDDNFFVPGHKRNAERFGALADALERRGIGPFATVVKARPTDVDERVFSILRRRLNCIRCYVGVETDADAGLETLRRWAKSDQNHRSIEIVRALDLYVCFNLLLFDPDTTIDDVARNVEFMRFAPEMPFNFGRVELYAGTPLLERMIAEGRARGDWMQYDYSLASEEMERVFAMTMAAFHARNFGDDALANRIMGTRFDVEVCRHFHPDVFRDEWMREGRDLSCALAFDTADALDRIVVHVRDGAPRSEDDSLAAEIARSLRATERSVRDRARDLARTMQRALGRGAPLTDLGDRVATPLQDARSRHARALEVTP